MREKLVSTVDIITEAEGVLDAANYSDQNFDIVEQHLFQPTTEINYGNSKQELKTEYLSVDFEIQPLDKELSDLAKDYLRYHGLLGLEETPDVIKNLINLDNWQEAKKLQYNFGGRDIDIVDLADGYRIIFCPNSEIKHGSVYHDKKVVIFLGDIASVGALSVVLHEIGHIKDDQNLKRLGVDKLTYGVSDTDNEQAEKLRKEKDASLFALRILWPALRQRSEVKKDVVDFLSFVAYASYCKNARWASDVATYHAHGWYSQADYDADQAWIDDYNRYEADRSAWDKFKQSEEFTAWKAQAAASQKLYQIDDDIEAFIYWREWIETTGKVNDENFLEKYYE